MCQATLPVENVVTSERMYMRSSSSDHGVAGIIGGLLVVSMLISVVTGDFSIWVPVLLAIVVSLRAVRSNRR